MASRRQPAEVIRISEDDTTASSAGESRSVSPSLGNKRELEDPDDVFADDPDDHFEKYQQSKKRKRATGKIKRKRKTLSDDPQETARGDLEEEDFLKSEELVRALVPEHIRQRRKLFEQNRKTFREAGLKSPPEYKDIEFSDDEKDLRELKTRPKFDNVEACRPCEDIVLGLSGGVIPASIARYLRDYQVEGVQFLYSHFAYQTGCVLGDDMGLGKTVQVAAFLTVAFGKTGDERDAKRLHKISQQGSSKWYPRVLVICPGSLIENWKNELDRWGWWKVEVYHGSGRDDALKAARSGALEIMITTYETYRHDEQKLNLVAWDAVIADECHKIKDRRSKITIAMDKVNALCRIGLTGTAIQNKYEELWTLLNWTNPAHFGSLTEWDRIIAKPLILGQSHDATFQQLSRARNVANKLVQKILPKSFLRRLKSLIAHQLPKKSDKVVFCPLTDYQRLAYENLLGSPDVRVIRNSVELCECGAVGNSGKRKKQGWCCGERLPDGRRWQALVFPTIMALQKISNHLTLLLPKDDEIAEKKASALDRLTKCVPDWKTLYANRNSLQMLTDSKYCGKWRILKKLLSFWHENNDKVLIFSHSVRLLKILHHLFTSTTIYTVSFLDGSLSYTDRQKEVDNFNSDSERFIFLISTKAGGVGLNITSANKVVVFDPHWNPSYDLQAQDRAYRIGQVRDVEVFRLVSAGTIEEIVYARQIYKQQQANIGYNASSERRYFKGVQKDPERKGELFGLQNLFTFQADKVVLKEIVNATNIAEARAGVHLVDVNMAKIEEDNQFSQVKQEVTDDNDEDAGMSQLAALIKSENPEDLVSQDDEPKEDAIQAILASAGVKYTHENSEVIGSSKVEEQISRRAALAEQMDLDPEGHSALCGATHVNEAFEDGPGYTYKYKPPQDVMYRQFWTMSRYFGYASATEFGVAVQSWTQEQRRDCLDAFYKMRMEKLLGKPKHENLRGAPKSHVAADKGLQTAVGGLAHKDEHASKTQNIDEHNSVASDGVRREVKAETEQEAAVNEDGGASTKRMISSIFIYDDDSDVL